MSCPPSRLPRWRGGITLEVYRTWIYFRYTAVQIYGQLTANSFELGIKQCKFCAVHPYYLIAPQGSPGGIQTHTVSPGHQRLLYPTSHPTSTKSRWSTARPALEPAAMQTGRIGRSTHIPTKTSQQTHCPTQSCPANRQQLVLSRLAA